MLRIFRKIYVHDFFLFFFFRNQNFYGNRQTQLVSKRQISDHVQAHLENIVCCRMREGFIIEVIVWLMN